MKIGNTVYVIVNENGRVVDEKIYLDIQEARDELAWHNKFDGPVHRIAEVRLVEVTTGDAGGGA